MNRFLYKTLRRTAQSLGIVPKYNELSDEYIRWLRWANAGTNHITNDWLMDYVIQRLSTTSPLLEIGSFCGLSTNIITYLTKKHNKKNVVFSCDCWAFDKVQIPGLQRVGAEYSRFCKQSFITNTTFFNHDRLPSTVEMPSNDFFLAWNAGREVTDVYGRSAKLGGPLSFCFLDGNHDYEWVKRDFENCDAHLEVGGYLLLDDSADGSGWDVCKVVNEIKATRRYRFVAKNPNYLFQKHQ